MSPEPALTERKGRRGLVLLAVTSVASLTIGALMVYAYVQHGFIATVGRPDQSLRFWYLPFLMFGSCLLVLGLILGWGGYRRYRRLKDRN